MTDKEIRWIDQTTPNNAWLKQVQEGSGPEALATASQGASSSEVQRHQQDQDSQRNTADLNPEAKKKTIDGCHSCHPCSTPEDYGQL